MANHACEQIETNTLTATNRLIHATVQTIINRLNIKSQSNTNTGQPPWQRMLENKINNIRKQIAHLEIIKQGKKHATQQQIYEYHLNCKHIKTIIEERRQIHTAGS